MYRLELYFFSLLISLLSRLFLLLEKNDSDKFFTFSISKREKTPTCNIYYATAVKEIYESCLDS